jgi:ribosomal protein S18 acetylase RimI-like enzyme
VSLVIRAATIADLPAIAALAGELVRQHHAFDARRFMLIPNVEAGYARFFQRELSAEAAVILAAELDGAIIGYAYARLEGRDWNNLLDACGALHDVFVAESARRTGVARQLVGEVEARLRAKGAPRLVLHTASQNAAARRFFAALGFRETMAEMTRELA